MSRPVAADLTRFYVFLIRSWPPISFRHVHPISVYSNPPNPFAFVGGRPSWAQPVPSTLTLPSSPVSTCYFSFWSSQPTLSCSTHSDLLGPTSISWPPLGWFRTPTGRIRPSREIPSSTGRIRTPTGRIRPSRATSKLHRAITDRAGRFHGRRAILVLGGGFGPISSGFGSRRAV